MRKVTAETARALREGRSVRRGNTRTDGEYLFLHGHVIAHLQGDTLRITLAGYPTATTVERVNGVLQEFGLPHRFHRRQGGAVLRWYGENGWHEDEVDVRTWFTWAIPER